MLLHTRLSRLAVFVAAAVVLAALPAVAGAAQGGGGGGGSGGGGGGGGEETTIGNNLSFPTIWSEGTALTMRGTMGAPTLVTQDPTTGLYLQGVEENTWQADNAVATEPVNVSEIDWGDNVESRSLSTGKPIRVETTLLENLVDPTTMLGFTMVSAGGTKDAEIFGTDGVTYPSTQAAIYSACMRLTIQRLDISRDDPYVANLKWDAATGEWTGQSMVESPLYNGAYSAEINGSGKVVYGYNWTATDVAGDYRLTASLDPNCSPETLNTFITDATTIYVTSETEGEVTAAAEPVGSGAKIDAADNLTYIDVRLGTPTYEPYVPPPTNTTLPAIGGTTIQGQLLTVSNGSWDNAPTSYAYQWQSCDSAGASCTDIAGATAGSYTLTSADVGRTIQVVVTAVNDSGSTQATSALSDVVKVPAPLNTDLPTISGTVTQGQVLKVSKGGWQYEPSSYSYQWLSCDSIGLGCTEISGATGASYTLGSADVGHGIRVLVTASNGTGSTKAYSGFGGVVMALQGKSSGNTSGGQGQGQNQGQGKGDQKQLRVRADLSIHLTWLKGERLRVWGFVRPAHNGQKILIQRLTHSSGWKTVARVSLDGTSQRSKFLAELAHMPPGLYRAYLGADTAHLATASTRLRARGLPRVTMNMRHLRGERMKLTGAVRPQRDGERLVIQRLTAKGWKSVAGATLRHVTKYRSQYTVKFAQLKPGTYRAHLAGNSAYRPSNSRLVRVR